LLAELEIGGFALGVEAMNGVEHVGSFALRFRRTSSTA